MSANILVAWLDDVTLSGLANQGVADATMWAQRYDPGCPSEFYRGNESGFGAISQNLDVKRTFADSVLVDVILVSEDPNRPSELFMVKGPAGNGKSVALKRIAWEAGITYDHIALFANGPSGIRIDPLERFLPSLANGLSFSLTGSPWSARSSQIFSARADHGRSLSRSWVPSATMNGTPIASSWNRS